MGYKGIEMTFRVRKKHHETNIFGKPTGSTLLFFIRTLKNLAEPEDVLISSHTFSLIFGQISASTFL